ncbi:hypothetical protein CBP31_01505 [Oceanisphaera profunda]|uniref:Uncharacterized protein n=1 Tax=Oceanisphaera profunda TaxID=1416627 RepID=A0A1Y0D1S3_9GAMM|nr:hypothetical protein [Oceanisphaera profunda]ART81472.1 hypothetical protein CBP31_01505 [Oceanisphaera profunda]
MIYAFVKIFTEEFHAEAFRKGDLYMQTIRMFKEHKDESGELRGDQMEGVVAWYQPDKIKLEVSGHEIPSSEIASPIAIHSNELLENNAFCIYSLNSQGHETVSAETIKDFKRTLEIHEACYGLGAYCVAVLNAQEFINRCQEKVRSLNVDGKLGLVDYFDEMTFNGELPKEKHGFQKRSFFSHQREYRVLANLHRDPDIYTMNIGDLRDITTQVITPDEFNRQLEIRLPNGSSA